MIEQNKDLLIPYLAKYSNFNESFLYVFAHQIDKQIKKKIREMKTNK